MTLRRMLPGFLIGVGLLALACWLPAMVLLWLRLPLVLPSPSDPWVVQGGLAAVLLAALAVATGVWLVRRAGRPVSVSRQAVRPDLKGDVVRPQGKDAMTDEQENKG